MITNWEDTDEFNRAIMQGDTALLREILPKYVAYRNALRKIIGICENADEWHPVITQAQDAAEEVLEKNGG